MIIHSGNDTQNDIIKLIEKTLRKSDIDIENYFFKEGDFAESLKISRSKIREAISSLEIRGYVKRVHGRGIKAINCSVEALSNSLTDMLKRNDFEYTDIIQFRNILEVKGAGIAALKRDACNLSKMQKYIKIMNQNVTYKTYLDADFLFHEEIINATQNKMLVALITSYSKLIRYAIEMSTDENYRPELDKNFHLKIYESILAGDSTLAEMSMEAHLNASIENIDTLKKVKSISW